ncbi:UNVERIFIED_CONTAM: hypothetical protein HDU68_005819 [Siphonaria sp. JEL0065]|nr:hypothetical protein HDU68_005819 [Siphonaria sp. JEL0065]
MDYLLNATSRGSLYAADVISQLVDLPTEKSKGLFVQQIEEQKQSQRKDLKEQPETKRPQKLESFFANQNNYNIPVLNKKEEPALVLGSLEKAASKGGEGAKYLYSKLSWFDKILVKDSEPQIETIVKSVNEKVADEEFQEDSVAPLLLNVKKLADQGSSVGSTILKSFFSVLVGQEDNGREHSADQVFSEYFSQAKSTKREPKQPNEADALADFFKFIEGKVLGGSKSATVFAQTLNDALVKSGSSQNNHRTSFKSMFVDSLEEQARQSNTRLNSGLNEFIKYVSRGSAVGNPASTGISSTISNFKKTLSSSLVDGEPFVKDYIEVDQRSAQQESLKSFFAAAARSSPVKEQKKDAYKPIFLQEGFQPVEQNIDLEAIKSKWSILMDTYRADKFATNYLSTFFVNQNEQPEKDTSKPKAAVFLGSLQNAATQGNNAAKTLLSKLSMVDQILSPKADAPLTKIVENVNKRTKSIWVQQEPVAPLLMELKTSVDFGDVLSSELLKKFFSALTVGPTTRSTQYDAKIFADYFQSPQSKNAIDTPVHSFLNFIKDRVQAGSTSAAYFANSLSDVLVNGRKQNYGSATSFQNIFTSALENQKTSSSLNDFVRYLSKSSLRGNPLSAGLLAEILVSSNLEQQQTKNAPIFNFENDDLFGLLNDVLRVSLDSPATSIQNSLVEALQSVKFGLSSYLVGGPEVDNKATAQTAESKQPVDASFTAPLPQRDSKHNGLKDFFIEQNIEKVQTEPVGLIPLLNSLTDAAFNGGQSAQTILSRIWAADKAVSGDSETSLATIWPTPSKSQASMWVDQEPVAPLLQSLKNSADSGDVLASSLLKTFFQALVSSGDTDPAIRAADSVFGDYFAQAKVTPHVENDEAPIDRFVKYLKSLGNTGPAGTFKSSLGSMLTNGKEARSFNDIFVETFDAAFQSSDRKPATNEFVKYLTRAASNGSPNAASFLSDILISGQPLLANSKTNSFESIFTAQPRNDIFSASEPSRFLSLFADISKLSVGKSSPNLQANIVSGLNNLKKQLTKDGRKDSIFAKQDGGGFGFKAEPNRWDRWVPKAQVPKVVSRIMVNQVKSSVDVIQDENPHPVSRQRNNPQQPDTPRRSSNKGSWGVSFESIFPGAYDGSFKPQKSPSPVIKSQQRQQQASSSFWSNIFLANNIDLKQHNSATVSAKQRTPATSFGGYFDFTKKFLAGSQEDPKPVKKQPVYQQQPSNSNDRNPTPDQFSEFLLKMKQKIGDSTQFLSPILASDKSTSSKPRKPLTQQPLQHNSIKPLRSTSNQQQQRSMIQCDIDKLPNGNFQNGKLTHWITVREPSSEGDVIVARSGERLGYSGIEAAPSSTDSPMAVFDNEGSGSYVLYRDFVPEAGDLLTFQWQVSNYAINGYSIQQDSLSMGVAPNQQFRVDLFDASRRDGGFKDWFGESEPVKGDGFLLSHIVDAQAAKSHDKEGWQEVRFDLTQFAGMRVRLVFRLVNNQDILTAAVQNVYIHNSACN